jgi:hypothetical protein
MVDFGMFNVREMVSECQSVYTFDTTDQCSFGYIYSFIRKSKNKVITFLVDLSLRVPTEAAHD